MNFLGGLFSSLVGAPLGGERAQSSRPQPSPDIRKNQRLKGRGGGLDPRIATAAADVRRGLAASCTPNIRWPGPPPSSSRLTLVATQRTPATSHTQQPPLRLRPPVRKPPSFVKLRPPPTYPIKTDHLHLQRRPFFPSSNPPNGSNSFVNTPAQQQPRQHLHEANLYAARDAFSSASDCWLLCARTPLDSRQPLPLLSRGVRADGSGNNLGDEHEHEHEHGVPAHGVPAPSASASVLNAGEEDEGPPWRGWRPEYGGARAAGSSIKGRGVPSGRPATEDEVKMLFTGDVRRRGEDAQDALPPYYSVYAGEEESVLDEGAPWRAFFSSFAGSAVRVINGAQEARLITRTAQEAERQAERAKQGLRLKRERELQERREKEEQERREKEKQEQEAIRARRAEAEKWEEERKERATNASELFEKCEKNPHSQIVGGQHWTRIEVWGRDVVTLQDRVWLNDQVIDSYLQLAARAVLMPAEDAPTGRLRWGDTGAFVWNTQFWNKLSGEGKNGTNAYNYANVRRWTTRRGNLDVFALDLLLVPLGDGTHWTLGVVDFKRRELLHFCSLGWAKPSWLTCVKKYLADEWRDKKKDRPQPFCFATGWAREAGTRDYLPGVPQQNNSSDCGVFAIVFAVQLLQQFRRAPEKRPFVLDATPEGIRDWRNRIALDIAAAGMEKTKDHDN